MKEKKSSSATKKNNLDGKWTFDVNLCNYSPKRVSLLRKITTRGVFDYHLDGRGIVEKLQDGYEVRLCISDKEAIRLFPVLSTDLKSVYVCAQSMGSFRANTYSTNEVSLHRRGKEMTKDEVDSMVSTAKKRNEDWKKNVIEVTPDTVLTCPTCGTLLRVGRSSKPPTLEAA